MPTPVVSQWKIAKAAGVSAMTVSRAFDPTFDGITEETRSRILQIAKESGYCCHQCGQSKILGITIRIGVGWSKFCSNACAIEYLIKL